MDKGMDVLLFSDETLAAALARIPSKRESELRFIGFGPEEICLSYRQLYEEARRRGAHLTGRGFRKGDRLGLMISEAHEFIMSFVGCVLSGIIPVPLSPPMTARAGEYYLSTTARILTNAGARGLLTTESGRGFAEQVLQDVAHSPELMVVEKDFSTEPTELIPPRLTPEDVCFLQYTSGSTSTPRGVMVTHANLMANISAFLGPVGVNVGPEDVGVSWLPLYHDMGLIGMVLGPLIYVGPLIILSTTSFARDPRSWLKAIDKYRGTITFAPNFAFAQVLKRLRDQDLEKLDLSCLRVVGCGAEPIQAATLRSFAERLAPVGFRAETLLPSYGLAESTLAVSLHRLGTPIRTEYLDLEALAQGIARPISPEAKTAVELVSCGFPLPDHDVAILNDDGERLGEREIGEITVQGKSVAQGYYENPTATASTWRHGRMHTGDLGYLADGELFVCGRKKELIIIRGANYYPHDIEATVRELPGIKRGNVTAFSTRRDGVERLIVVAEADPREGEELRQAIATRILEALGLEVGEVVLIPVGGLPRTTSGKLQRAKVAQLYEESALPKLEKTSTDRTEEE